MQYDIDNLCRLFEQLDGRNRLKALKGAFRRAANQVRRTAMSNLRATGINHAAEVGRGIRTVVWKRKAGFRVTAGDKKANKQGKGERGMYATRRQGHKPVLRWLEDGTKMRQTRYGFGRSRKRASRGQLTRYGYMDRTKSQVSGTVTDMVHKEIIDNVTRIARKYGCK